MKKENGRKSAIKQPAQDMHIEDMHIEDIHIEDIHIDFYIEIYMDV